MLNVLLVDDEPGAIKSLKYVIDWEREGFRIAAEATDGDQALEMMKEHTYAVVFSDIQMPGMDGLLFFKELRAYPFTYTIAVSGYDKFEYVKQCLKYGVKDYLLKPVKEEDLLTLLRKLKADIESDILRDKQRTLGIQATRSDAVKQWMLGIIPFLEAERMLRWCGIEIPTSDTWTAVAIEIDALDQGDSNWTAREWQTTTFAVRNVLEEFAMPTGGVFEDEQGCLGLVLATGNSSVTQTAESVRFIRDTVLKYTKIPLTFGIGTPVHNPEEAPASYQTALSMLERKFLIGNQSVIIPSTLHMESENISDAHLHFVTDMLDAVKLGHNDLALQRLSEQVDIWKRIGTSKTDVQAVVVEFMVGLYHHARQYGEHGERFFHQKSADRYRAILNSRTLDQLILITRQTGQEWVDFLTAAKWNQPSNPVNEAKQMLEAHYSEQLSLKSIAERIHMNAAYLGQLFKAAEGVTFNDYLLQLRMNKARELLAVTDMKVYEVALFVGYKQLDWFYKKFKETFGVSANEYRTKLKYEETPPASLL